MNIDFHTHILPAIDDGAKNIDISMSILEKEKDDGVDIIVATPHFYRNKENISSFLKRRENAYSELSKSTEYLSFPKIVLGAEVYFSPSLIDDESIESLCIDNTKYMLLEMPYQQFTKNILDNLRNFVNSTNVIPVMAHIERYLNFTDIKNIYEMMSMDVLGQINCSSLTTFSTRKKALKLIESGVVHVIGTDVHNTVSRPALFREAKDIIINKCSEQCFNRLMTNSENILKNAGIDRIL